MKILLLSDTHGHIDDWIIKHAEEVDEIWHAGDIGDLSVTDTLESVKPIKAVYGNIDNHVARVTHPQNQVFHCEGKKVVMTHIGGYPPRWHKRILPFIQATNPDIFICGHSHILKVIFDKNKNILHLNPGAAGLFGIQKVRTMLKFEIKHGDIMNMQIIEKELINTSNLVNS
jgi:uncharacterized protein